MYINPIMVCSCCWPGLCLLSGSRSGLGWAWEVKQPWGQETSLRRHEGSELCRVGGVRVCAPPQLAPKFSPDGPSATVPVLGCSFPEESYPSLANQPSSGAKQGDVRCAREGGAVPLTVISVSLVADAPVASTPSTCLGIPSPAGGAPALVTS